MYPMDPHHMDGVMYGSQGAWMAPLVGGFFTIFLLLTLLGAWQMWRHRDQLGTMAARARLGRPMTAEHKAREILAERFARGEIDSQEFMERSSMLNWTPGVEPPAQGKKG